MIKRLSLSLLIILCFFTFVVNAQKIDTTSSFRDIDSEKYFRFQFDNDYFANKDQDYTEGFNIQVFNPCFAKNPINYLIFKPKNAQITYGVSVEHISYTPENIGSDEIQFGDRPFASALILNSTVVSTDTVRKSRFNTIVSLGLIGQGSLGETLQLGWHQLTRNVLPQGWRYQIKNDIVLTYTVQYEKELLRANNWFSLQTTSRAQLGTLFTNAGVGFNMVLGLINEPFSAVADNKKLRLYVYIQPMAHIVGYDATLQGGMFNNDSVYTIASGDVERFTGQYVTGIVIQKYGFYAEFTRTSITREFANGRSSHWGGLRVGYYF